MTITKAEILTEVNSRTARQETNIDSQIKAVLLDLTIDFPFIKNRLDMNTTKDDPDYPLPSEVYRNVEIVALAKIGKEPTPLDRISTFAGYLSLLHSSTTTGIPTSYIIHNKILYLYPTPDDAYPLTIIGSALEQDPNSVGLPDEFEEAITEGTCYKLYESKGLASTSAAQDHLVFYQDAVRKLKKIHREDIEFIHYHDL